MPKTALAKVEDAAAAVIEEIAAEGQPLDGWSVLTEQSADEAVEGTRQIVIYTSAAQMGQSDELGQTFWNQTLEIEFIEGPQATGSISRANQEAMAHAHAALAADRTLGGMLHDLQEIDMAGTQAEGKDVDSASVQYRAQFFTPRDDWFTILGQGGQEF